ncbi:MAG: TRAP transporter substrate-binding protein DctP [Thermoleophilia bacterium]|nr:TRAP transporter substrate-binding protein DctP [Thermoleophilia bacterium]
MKKALILGVVLVLAFAMGMVACGEDEPTTTTAAAQTTTTAAAGTTTTAAAATTTSAAAETTTTSTYAEGTWKFTFNNFMPPTNNIGIVSEMLCAEITERTNGAVQFEYLPGGSLTKADKVFDSVVTGIADLGYSCFTYTPGVFPVMELLDYPLGYPHGYVNTMVVNEFYNEFKPAELDDVHVLCLYGTGPQVLFTASKPVRALADAKGLVIRSTGVGAAIAGALGAEGYAAAQNEAYELLSKGVIDGSIAPREVLAGWKHAEVAKYVTQAFSIGSITAMYMVMNEDKWADLPPEIQQVFTDVAQESIEAFARVSAAYDYAGIEYFNSLGDGREVIDLSEEEGAAWKAAVQPIVDKKLGDLQGAGFTDDYQGFVDGKIQEWLPKAPSEADCAAWVKDNIKSPSAQ